MHGDRGYLATIAHVRTDDFSDSLNTATPTRLVYTYGIEFMLYKLCIVVLVLLVLCSCLKSLRNLWY
jgi:hypothetical protein